MDGSIREYWADAGDAPSPIRVLIADDNRAHRDRVAAHLAADRAFDVIGCAADGEEALAICERARPALLLLDIVMPRLDGFAVLRALQKQRVSPRVIVVSALSGDDMVARAMALGARYYCVKPVDPAMLRERCVEIASARELLGEPEALSAPRSDERAAKLFLALGIPANIKGYQYLKEAVRVASADRAVLGRITKELYPAVARRCATSPSRVERAMRHAIDVAWSRGRLDSVNQALGCKVFLAGDRPSNGEFIAMVADHVKEG